MKIEQMSASFTPVTITLESREEAGILATLIGPTSCRGRVAAYLANGLGTPDQDDERLLDASQAFSLLYSRLDAVLNNK